MDLLGALPFPLLSLQVDGGSEFMGDFEDACKEMDIPLHVLPPRRPQWNGCVERANRSARAEFWSLYSGPLTVHHDTPHLAKYEFFFNYERPHASLAYRTPNEYFVIQGGCLALSAQGVEPVHSFEYRIFDILRRFKRTRPCSRICIHNPEVLPETDD